MLRHSVIMESPWFEASISCLEKEQSPLDFFSPSNPHYQHNWVSGPSLIPRTFVARTNILFHTSVVQNQCSGIIEQRF